MFGGQTSKAALSISWSQGMMHKSMQAAHFEMISRLGEIQFFQRTLRSLIRQMPMLSSLTRQWLLRFLAAQSFSLLLCNFSLAFGANQTWAANFRKFHLTCSWRTAFLHRQAFQLQTTLLYLGLIKTKWSCDLMQAMGMRFITERRFNSLPCQSYPASAFNNGYMGERLKLKAER